MCLKILLGKFLRRCRTMVKPLANNWCDLELVRMDSFGFRYKKKFKQSISSEPGFYRDKATSQDGFVLHGSDWKKLTRKNKTA